MKSFALLLSVLTVAVALSACGACPKKGQACCSTGAATTSK
ncbi:MAG TPA: hypothetical protein VF593_06540 [Chthoniobacteraceae bacterium]